MTPSQEHSATLTRRCNRCNAVLTAVGVCPACGCPEYRLDGPPKTIAEAIYGPAAAKRTPSPKTCPRCLGCGRIANTPEGEPWSQWEHLPPGSNLAVATGLVAPIACPTCWGRGHVAPAAPLSDQYREAVAEANAAADRHAQRQERNRHP